MHRLLAYALICAPLVNACAAEAEEDADGVHGLAAQNDSSDAGNPGNAGNSGNAGNPGAAASDASAIPSEADAAPPCVPGASCTYANGTTGMIVCDGVVAECVPTCPPTGCSTGAGGTPLVLAFGRDVRFTDADGAFDLFGIHAGGAIATPIATRWVGAETPWIALDRNRNGRIDDGSELFGSMTELPGGATAPNGFMALAALDSDGDGKITARDARYGDLVLWRDFNQDRASQPGELTSLAEEGIESIDLAYGIETRCVDGDCEVERGRAVVREGSRSSGAQAAVIDVHFAARADARAHR